jgi:acetyltransferase-like isoleucine patch superfamily enzyme
MVVESDVFIGPHVSTANDNSMGLSEHVVRRGPHICRGASIGVGAILLANIRIGEQAVVAAGALVDRDVPERKLVLGLPARVVKDVGVDLLKPLE